LARDRVDDLLRGHDRRRGRRIVDLAGDSTDNVPGVPGIGIKTAATLIQDFGDLETLLALLAPGDEIEVLAPGS
jgi:5'-3' exonuclease